MHHAFLFSSYRNSDNMAAAIQALQHDNASFAIHVDKKVAIATDEHLSILQQASNIHFVADRVKVNWGGLSHLRALIKLMEYAVANTSADYVHLMSDGCYPIKPFEAIDAFFEQHKGKEYITYEPLPSKEWPYGGLNRIQYYHLHDIINVKKSDRHWYLNENLMLLQKHLRLKRRMPFDHMQYYGGGTWWSLSRAAVQYCLDKIAATPDFYRRYKYSFCFEESCFQTILMNSPFKPQIVNDDLRYIDWSNRNGNNPANLDETDYDKLMACDDLFARKFIYPTGKKLAEKVAAAYS